METVEVSLSEIVKILSKPWSVKEWLITITPLAISFLSIVFAIYVPNRIMNKQNKIALFDKRFTIKQQVKEILDFCLFIEKMETFPQNQIQSNLVIANNLFSLWCSKKEDLRNAFKLLQKEPTNGNIKLNMLTVASKNLQEQVTILESSEYLFDDKISKIVLLLSKNYNEFMTLVISSVIVDDMKEYENKKKLLCSFLKNNDDIVKKINCFLKI